jgi:peptide deformylase
LPASILTLPDPRLRLRAEPVARFDRETADRLDTLERAMRAGPGGVGIAAPQLGLRERMIIVDCRLARRPCQNHGLLRLLNPEVERGEGRVLGREGCLSVPDWVAMVPRAPRISVRYQDEHGQWQALETSGFEARVIQHEVDHLDGILFIDRVVSVHDLTRRAPAG